MRLNKVASRPRSCVIRWRISPYEAHHASHDALRRVNRAVHLLAEPRRWRYGSRRCLTRKARFQLRILFRQTIDLCFERLTILRRRATFNAFAP